MIILWLLSVIQRYWNWKQFTTHVWALYSISCCYQSFKDTEIESNSQQGLPKQLLQSGCYQSFKDTEIESNSQPLFLLLRFSISCYQSFKDTEIESNSQLDIVGSMLGFSCYQSFKDTEIESNSQPISTLRAANSVVISHSKILKLKAIHNSLTRQTNPT